MQIFRNFNYNAEAALLLHQIVNGRTSETILKELQAKTFYHKHEEDFTKAAAILDELHRALRNSIDLDDKRVQMLFKSSTDRDGSLPLELADVLVDFCGPELKPKPHQSRFAAIVSYMNDPAEHPDVCDEETLMQYIFSLDVPDSIKYTLIYCLHNFDTLQLFTMDLLKKAADAVMPILSGLEKEQEKYLAAIPHMEQGLYEFFEKSINIKLKLDSNTSCQVYPHFANFASLLAMSEWDSENLHIFIGCYVFGVRDNASLGPGNIAAVLKALSDDTKLKILQMLKTEPLYSAQIAERLQLTPATISHHTSVLQSLALLSLEKVHNRVYFSLRTETLENLLGELRTMLL